MSRPTSTRKSPTPVSDERARRFREDMAEAGFILDELGVVESFKENPDDPDGEPVAIDDSSAHERTGADFVEGLRVPPEHRGPRDFLHR